MASSRTASQRQRALGPKLRVMQLVVQPVLLNEHDCPVTPDPLIFTGDDNGTAADNLSGWLAKLPLHLEIAAAQFNAPPADQNGASE